jgi:hypothetical protein
MNLNLEAGDYLICSSQEYNEQLELVQLGRHPTYTDIQICDFHGENELKVFVTYKTPFMLPDSPPVPLQNYRWCGTTSEELLKTACEAYDQASGGGHENVDDIRMKAALEAVLEKLAPEFHQADNFEADDKLVDEFVANWILRNEAKHGRGL